MGFSSHRKWTASNAIPARPTSGRGVSNSERRGQTSAVPPSSWLLHKLVVSDGFKTMLVCLGTSLLVIGIRSCCCRRI
jgi:hypothetical protein